MTRKLEMDQSAVIYMLAASHGCGFEFDWHPPCSTDVSPSYEKSN